MNIKNTFSKKRDTIKKVKLAISTRKYAHADEISLLWQDALKSSAAISWGKVMLISIIASAIIVMITALSH